MPIERIYTAYKDHDECTQVEVAWGRDQSVSLGAIAPEVAGSKPDGFWVHLDRAQINHLIRLLRRGRDQAYGQDE